MKKRLNEEDVMNELKKSLFFQPPPGQKTTKSIQRKSVSQSPIKTAPLPARKSTTSTELSVRDERPERPVRPVRETPKRETKRHAFEIYKDQLESLHELRLALMKSGELKSLSAMVREAFDNYIQNRTGSTTRTEIR